MSKSQDPFLSDDEIRNSIPFSTVNQSNLVLYPPDSNLGLLAWLKEQLATAKIEGAAAVNLDALRKRFIKDEAGDTQDLELLLVSGNKYLQTQVKLWFMGTQTAVIQDIVNFVAGTAGDDWSNQ